MDSKVLDLLRTPGGEGRLKSAEGELVAEDGRRFEVRDDIPRLLESQAATRWELFYDAAAFGYDATIRLGTILGLGSEERIPAELLGKLKLPSGSVVLDVGCGTGNNRAAFGSEVTYLGLDLSFQMLRRAKVKSKAHALESVFVQANAQELPIVSSCADLALAMGVMQHVQHPSLALQEAARVLRPGAEFLLIDESRSLPTLNRKLNTQGKNVQQLRVWLDNKTEFSVIEHGEIGEYYFLRSSKKV